MASSRFPFLIQRQEQYIKMNLSFAVMEKFLDLAVVSTNGGESLSSCLLAKRRRRVAPLRVRRCCPMGTLPPGHGAGVRR